MADNGIKKRGHYQMILPPTQEKVTSKTSHFDSTLPENGGKDDSMDMRNMTPEEKALAQAQHAQPLAQKNLTILTPRRNKMAQIK